MGGFPIATSTLTEFATETVGGTINLVIEAVKIYWPWLVVVGIMLALFGVAKRFIHLR